MERKHNPNLTPFAQQLRREMTKQERRLWYEFLKQLPVQVYRQRVIGPYIADFYCAAKKIVIELDGSQHYEAEGLLADQKRDAYFADNGITVLRFTNEDVNHNFRGVCEEIAKYLPIN